VGTHQKTPFNIDFGINSEKQDFKTATVGVWGTCGRREGK
jgi:hypothetical protein